MLILFAASATALLTIQAAKVDITPPEPLPLGGYTERGAKVFIPGGERLYARTVLLSQGKLKIAVVSVEMLTIPESLYREVQAKLPSGVKLFLSATHTHSAPDSQMLNERMTMGVPGIANFRPRWLDWYAAKIAAGVILAAKTRATMCEIVAYKRTFLPLNRGRRAGAEPDQSATTIWARGFYTMTSTVVDETIPLWFHYAAHAVFRSAEDLKLSGDWPGRIAASGFSVLPGAIGDVSPAADGANANAKIATFVKVADESLKFPGLARAGISATSLAWSSAKVTLGSPTAHPDFAKKNGIPDSLAQVLVSRFAPPAASVSAFRIGKLAVVGIPGEPTSHLGRAIVAEGRALGFFPVLVVSHVNGWTGYILDPEDYDRGGYEATLSLYGREQGNRVVDAAAKALAQLK